MEKIDNRQQKNLVDVREVLDDYLDTGKPVIPLRKGYKKPFTGWRESQHTLEQLLEHDGNYGFRVTPEFLVIDVDVKDGKKGLESFEKLKSRVDSPLKININTPSGGFHVYVEIPDEFRGFRINKKQNEYPGIEFLQDGAFAVIPPSHTIEDKAENQCEGHYTFTNIRTMSACKTGTAGLFNHLLSVDGETYNPNAVDGLTPAPETVRITSKSKTKQSGKVAPKTAPTASHSDDTDDDDDDFDNIPLGVGLGASYDVIKKALYAIDPALTHDEWVKVGMALHSWDKLDGLALWDEWSKGCKEKYKERGCAKKWKTFKVDGGTGIGTLFHMAKEYSPDIDLPCLDDNDLVKKFLDRIAEAPISEIREEIVPEIIKMDFDKVNKSLLVKAIQDSFKAETGVSPGVKSIRDLLNPKKYTSSAPEWCQPWIFVSSRNVFYHSEKCIEVKSDAFNQINGHFVPMNENDSKPYASKYVADNAFLTVVDRSMYYPFLDDQIFELDGLTYFNEYDAKRLPVTAKRYTDKGLKAIKLIENHTRMIMGNEENYSNFTQWLAHNVQFMGKKIRWSPCIQSIDGVGKTFFYEMLKKIMGDRNVGSVPSKRAKSDFNGWAYGKCVVAFEELKVSGHNRHEVTDAIKPLITNTEVNIHKKGVDDYNVINTSNYMCFTNHKDALPLNGNDRRWFIIQVPFADLQEFENHIGKNEAEYFNELFDAIENHASEIRKWFLEYPITDEFKNRKRAPVTAEKLALIATEEANFEGYLDAIEILEKGSPLFDTFVISTSDFFDKLTLDCQLSLSEFSIYKKTQLLKKLGFNRHEKKIKIKGEVKTFWTKQPMTADEIKTYIDTRVKPSRYDFSKKTNNEPDPDAWSNE